jgi:hypothetical protein
MTKGNKMQTLTNHENVRQRTNRANMWNDALNIDELRVTLENISNDDKRTLESYTRKEVASEAKYVLSTFFESGHLNNESYIGELGQAEYEWAALEVAKLQQFIQNFGK